MGGSTRAHSMKTVQLILIVACALSLTVQGSAGREKPEDWDDALDGEWEAPKEGDDTESEVPAPPPYKPPPQDQYESQSPDAWKNNHETTLMWEAINANSMDNLNSLIKTNPRVIHCRAEDGRGPLFWAYEYGHTEMIKLLEDLGIDPTVTDKDGLMPEQLAQNREL